MFNNKVSKIIKSKNLYKDKIILKNFKKCKKKYKYLFFSYKNFEKKILTNLCLH